MTQFWNQPFIDIPNFRNRGWENEAIKSQDETQIIMYIRWRRHWTLQNRQAPNSKSVNQKQLCSFSFSDSTSPPISGLFILEFHFSNICFFSSSPSIQRNFDQRHFQPSLTCISFSLLAMMSTFTSALSKTKSPSGSKQLKRTTQTFS